MLLVKMKIHLVSFTKN